MNDLDEVLKAAGGRPPRGGADRNGYNPGQAWKNGEGSPPARGRGSKRLKGKHGFGPSMGRPPRGGADRNTGDVVALVVVRGGRPPRGGADRNIHRQGIRKAPLGSPPARGRGSKL